MAGRRLRLRRWLILGVLMAAGPGTPGVAAQSPPAVELLAGGWLSPAAVEGGANVWVTESFGFGVRGAFAPAWPLTTGLSAGGFKGAAAIAYFRRVAERGIELHTGIGLTGVLQDRRSARLPRLNRKTSFECTMEFLAGHWFSRRFGVRAGLGVLLRHPLDGGIRFLPKVQSVVSF